PVVTSALSLHDALPICTSAFTTPPRLDDLDMHKYAQAGFGIGVLTKLGGFYYPTSGSRDQLDQAAWRVIRPIDEVVQDVQNMQRSEEHTSELQSRFDLV